MEKLQHKKTFTPNQAINDNTVPLEKKYWDNFNFFAAHATDSFKVAQQYPTHDERYTKWMLISESLQNKSIHYLDLFRNLVYSNRDQN